MIFQVLQIFAPDVPSFAAVRALVFLAGRALLVHVVAGSAVTRVPFAAQFTLVLERLVAPDAPHRVVGGEDARLVLFAFRTVE